MICSPSDPIGVAAKKDADGSFSQVPVYPGNTLMGLLTSETVAGWLAAQLADGQGILQERPVQEVMRHEEGNAPYVVMGRTATIDDALAEFDDHMHVEGRCDYPDPQWEQKGKTSWDRDCHRSAKAPLGNASVVCRGPVPEDQHPWRAGCRWLRGLVWQVDDRLTRLADTHVLLRPTDGI